LLLEVAADEFLLYSVLKNAAPTHASKYEILSPEDLGNILKFY
jgi:hypothetical protein